MNQDQELGRFFDVLRSNSGDRTKSSTIKTLGQGSQAVWTERSLVALILTLVAMLHDCLKFKKGQGPGEVLAKILSMGLHLPRFLRKAVWLHCTDLSPELLLYIQ